VAARTSARTAARRTCGRRAGTRARRRTCIDEIESYVKRYGATNFPFQDLTAILKREWVVEFCSEVEQRNLKITWQLPAGTRSEIIDEEVARLLVRSGCRSLNFAPESGSERTRKHMKKMLTDEKLFRAVRASVKAGSTSARSSCWPIRPTRRRT
jgi:anaerobic magnesium-protoporphyrin IX monomethyl ester cyclase